LPGGSLLSAVGLLTVTSVHSLSLSRTVRGHPVAAIVGAQLYSPGYFLGEQLGAAFPIDK
jgi:hypothetical protein